MDVQPTIGQRVIKLASVDSTNKYAAKGLERQELGHGTAIMALEQTAGRGRSGRGWMTAKGLDLAASIVLLPEALAAPQQFILAKVAALAVHDVVADALRQAGADASRVRIKWPNDVLVERGKVAGILIANELKGPWVASAVVGIGLDVNSGGWPEGLRATSLLQETGLRRSPGQGLECLCRRMQHWWEGMRHPGEVDKAYVERLWAQGRFTGFTLDGAPFTARPLDVDAAGRLLVEDEAGEVQAYGMDRLRLLR